MRNSKSIVQFISSLKNHFTRFTRLKELRITSFLPQTKKKRCLLDAGFLQPNLNNFEPQRHDEIYLLSSLFQMNYLHHQDKIITMIWLYESLVFCINKIQLNSDVKIRHLHLKTKQFGLEVPTHFLVLITPVV